MLALLLLACGSAEPPPTLPPAPAAVPAPPPPPTPPAPVSCCADAELEKLLVPYLAAQEKLAKDDPSAATELVALGSLAEPAAKVTAETPLADQRAAFKAVSEALIPKVKASPGGATAVREVYCPMYPGSWLQKGETVSNPYYGSTMLTCGSFK